MTEPQQRRIRSFVRREGRLTRGQQRALDELLPRFGIDPAAGQLNLDTLFGRDNPKVLEIGFGNGASLAQQARDNPATDFVGIEVHRPGVGHLLAELQQLGLTNVRVVCADAVEVLQHCIADQALDGVQIFFPDPWPKKRHHKRRLVQPGFIQLIARKLKTGATLHLATDWQNYAEHMIEVLNTVRSLHNTAKNGGYVPRPAFRPLTKFEQRGQRLGHGVWDLVFRKQERKQA
jgi:tRNA (guanine-N7-)-methyltransferase